MKPRILHITTLTIALALALSSCQPQVVQSEKVVVKEVPIEVVVEKVVEKEVVVEVVREVEVEVAVEKIVEKEVQVEVEKIVEVVVQPTEAPAEAAGPRYGGTFIFATSWEPEHFNPAFTTIGGVRFISANVHPRIVRMNLDLDILPSLAESWDISEDGLIYTFYLDEQAVWEDGVPITAHDVAYTWSEIIPEYHIQASALTANWKEVRAEDDHTLVLEFEKPRPTFMLFAHDLGILPKHIYEGTDILENPNNLKPLSGGPYTFKEYFRGDHIVLERNENYWIEDRPYLDRIVIRFVTDPTARLSALEAQDVDYMFGYTSVAEAMRVADGNPDINMIMGGHWGKASISSTLGFNLRREPFGDIRVRKAIAHAIDKQFIYDTVTMGKGRISKSHFGSGNWASTDDVAVYEYDPAQSEKLLDEAGLARGSDGVRFSMDMHVATNQTEHLKVMEVLVDQLGAIGIEVIPTPNEKQTWEQHVFLDWEFDTALRGIATGMDPTGHATWRAYHSDNIKSARAVNTWGYSNPRVDELFDTARDQPTLEEMKPFLHELQQILMDEVASVPILERFEPYLWSAKFEGELPDYLGDWSRVWWVDGQPTR